MYECFQVNDNIYYCQKIPMICNGKPLFYNLKTVIYLWFLEPKSTERKPSSYKKIN